MANAIRTALFGTVLLIASIFPQMAVASADPGIPTTGATVLGAGFSGKPFVLEGDIVMETIGLYESIRDYNDATSPDWIAWYDHALGGIWQEVLHDDGLLVALRDAIRPGFEVVDLSDPSAPVGLADVDGNYFQSGWLRDHTLLVAGDNFMLAYDLADPTSPAFASFRTLGHHEQSRWFGAHDSVLYLVDEGASMRLFDVTDPQQPDDLGTVALAGDRIEALAMGEGVLYALIADDTAASVLLVTYDLANPLAPQEISRLVHSATGGAEGLQLRRDGDLLLAASSDARVKAYDVSMPVRPVAGYQLNLVAEHLGISANQIFAMTGEDVRIFPRTAADTLPGEPVVRSLLPRLRAIDGDGPVQVGQLHGTTNMLVPVDASNPRHPRVGAPFDTGLTGSFIYGDQLGMMVNFAGSFQLVDLSEPMTPTWLGSVSEPRVNFFRSALTSEVAVLETGSVRVELRFYDLADPMAPHFRSKVYDYGLADLNGDLMLCTRSDRIRIYDMSDLWNPHYLRQLILPGSVQAAKLHEGNAYVLTQDLSGQKMVHAVDLSDPAYPELVATIPIAHNAGRLDAHGGRLYAYGYHLCQIFDVAVPAEMALVAEFPAYGHTGSGLGFNDDVTTIGGWLVTMRDDGLSVSATPDQAPKVSSRLEPAYPNPLNPSTTVAFTVGQTRELSLSVHDVRGRLVARLASGQFTPGRHTVSWNGEDLSGLPVASGVYLVRLHGQGLEASGTVTVVK